MTRAELENTHNEIFRHTFYGFKIGTGAYWRQIAVNNWHDNVNNVQARYDNPTDFICKFFEVAVEKVERSSLSADAVILTLADA